MAPGLPWRDLLDRRDALILDIRSTARRGRAETLTVALIDTTGAARFAAMALPLAKPAAAAVGAGTADAAVGHAQGTGLSRPAGALPWPDVHGPLAQALEGAGVVLAWDVPAVAGTLSRAAQGHGLTLPAIPWRDLRADYRKLGYFGGSLAKVASRHGLEGPSPGTLAPCHLALSVMHACSH